MAALRANGFVLTPLGKGGEPILRVSPSTRLTPEWREAIREHKPGLLALLAAEQPATTPTRTAPDATTPTASRTAEAAGWLTNPPQAMPRVASELEDPRTDLAEVRREWAHYFPALPVQSEFNRRVRWLWGVCELLRQWLLATVPMDGWQQADTTALPVKHPSRVRGPDGWHGPGGLRAGFGFDAAHREWCYGFRLAVRTDLGSHLVRAWGLVPAAVDERAAAAALLEGAAPPCATASRPPSAS